MDERREEAPDFLSRHGPPHRAQERAVIPVGVPGLRLRFYTGVEPEVRRTLKDFARWLRGQVRFRHPVRVTVVPQATVMGHDGAAGWGVFLIPPDDYAPGDVVRIYLGGGSAAVMRACFAYGEAAALTKLAHDLAHEIVHYEQWRDGQQVLEWGVNRRAAALVTRWLESQRPPARRVAGRDPSGQAA